MPNSIGIICAYAPDIYVKVKHYTVNPMTHMYNVCALRTMIVTKDRVQRWFDLTLKYDAAFKKSTQQASSMNICDRTRFSDRATAFMKEWFTNM